MDQENRDEKVSAWEESHPWLSRKNAEEDGDSLDEVIRCTLDEIRLA